MLIGSCYILSHGYEGRLGKQLIAKEGLIYYISTQYHSDGQRGWITFSTGVNPDRLEELQERWEAVLEGLITNPPSSGEVEEAKQHWIGRRISAYQSNEEISGFYAREWVE